MRKEEKYIRDFSSLFDEAYDVESTPVQDSLEKESERYVRHEFYSEGGLKRIEVCFDTRTGRQVAMATPKESSCKQKMEAFLREAKLNAALQHPNIVPVYDLGVKDEIPWFTMKFIQGQSLEDIIQDLKAGKKSRYRDLNERLDIFLKVCEAIAYAHSVGVLHLDLKPDNIRVDNFGDVVVCDWGLANVEAAACDSSLLEHCNLVEYDLSMMTVDGIVKGSIGYMAPEQTGLTEIRKGRHTDIFSLGALLYSLLSLEKAFYGENFAEAVTKTSVCDFPKPSQINSDIPYSLEAVCLKAMSLKKEDRYQCVEDLRSDIQAYWNGFATVAENASLMKALKLFYLRQKTLSIISIISVILIIVLTVLSWNHLNLSKKNAEQLADKMSLEAEYQRKINKDAAPLFFERAKIAYQTFSFDDTLKFSTSAVELDSGIKEAWQLKGLVHFVTEQFNSASRAFEKAGISDFLSQLNAECLTIKSDDSMKLPIEDYVTIMRKAFAAKQYKIFGNMIHYKCYSDLSLEDRIAFVKGVIQIHHQKQLGNKEFDLNFDLSTGHLDLSGNPWLKHVSCLQNFPAGSADYSKTQIPNCVGFRSQPLTRLNISSTKINNLNTLMTGKLQELNISNTPIQNLDPIFKFPIEKLDIRKTAINSLLFTQKMKKLREIHLSQNQFTSQQLSKIPKRVKVIIH